MKKLMITAGAVAIAAGAFATAPTVYDYKASVKHMYLKEVVVRDTSLANPQNVHVYQKIQKTSSLKGYLIQDTQACLGGWTANQGEAANASRAWDQRRNRAFLVVLNSSAVPAEIRQPKILPAVLEAKFMDKALNNRTYLTEGMLFVGGDLVTYNGMNAPATNLRPYLMPGTVPAATAIGTLPTLYNTAAAISQSVQNPTTARARQTAKAYYGDYLWTSAYLFGQYNGPQWSEANWGVAESKVITGMPQFMRPRSSVLAAAVETVINPAPVAVGAICVDRGHGYFHDTWMNHAGFGTGVAGVTPASVCCGISTPATTSVQLDSLSGNMKGGIFICSENGFYTGLEAVAPYGVYRGGALWDDQFWAASINRPAGDVYPANTYFGTSGLATLWNNLGNGDNFQMDVWTDGDIETFTTDVMSGTWSIKRNTRLAGVALTLGEICGTFRNIAAPATAAVAPRAVTAPGLAAGFVAGNAQDVVDFNAMLKGAARNLSRTVIFANGTEISSKIGDGNRFTDLPMITPKFAVAYGLDGQHLYAAPAAIVNVNPGANVSVYNW